MSIEDDVRRGVLGAMRTYHFRLAMLQLAAVVLLLVVERTVGVVNLLVWVLNVLAEEEGDVHVR